jgi:uncharacterized protein YndB with AHSA1/START domain
MRVSTSAITINAPRDVVWSALTEPIHVRRWQYNSDLATDWEVGHSIRFSAEWQGQVFEQWGTVLDFDRPNRVRYSLFAPRPGLEDRPEHYFTMTYELSDVADGTRVTFIHEDPREIDGIENTVDEEDPVLTGLRDVVESLVSG